MELTWHGHSTWQVTVGDTELLIDPFFGNPKTDLEPGDVGSPDYVLITHGHDDHVGDVGAFTDATLAGTPEVTGHLADQHGFDDEAVVGFNLGGTVDLGDAAVTMHRADHTNGLESGFNAPAGGSPAGYVIAEDRPTEAGPDTTSFYHAGDTALMSEMRDVIAPFLDPDAAAVPIGDHFTMGPAQAARAIDWLAVDTAFPMHYDTFPPIEQDPEGLRQECEALGVDADVVVLDGDETVEL